MEDEKERIIESLKGKIIGIAVTKTPFSTVYLNIAKYKNEYVIQIEDTNAIIKTPKGNLLSSSDKQTMFRVRSELSMFRKIIIDVHYNFVRGLDPIETLSKDQQILKNTTFEYLTMQIDNKKKIGWIYFFIFMVFIIIIFFYKKSHG
jgi:hypothetical protein|tara:strand:- start:479 stop:919 length:441 start_codon:yes stop_codon:yes gene_type:complete